MTFDQRTFWIKSRKTFQEYLKIYQNLPKYLDQKFIIKLKVVLLAFGPLVFCPWAQTLNWLSLMQINWHVLMFTTVSTFTKGEQMVPVLNKLDVRCAVYGNHDFGKQNYFDIKAFLFDIRKLLVTPLRASLDVIFGNCFHQSNEIK